MGLFDYVKDGLLRRGKDDPLLRKGMEKLNDVLGERRRAQVSSAWPLASDPDGRDVFARLAREPGWALRFAYLPEQEFRPQRYDGVDASGWRVGRGVHVAMFDLDPEARAGSDGRENNDVWLEAMHEPVFGGLSFSVLPQAMLDDHESHVRHRELPDDMAFGDRRFHTGRLRGSGDWCALVHLDPLVLRIRVDVQDASRDKTANLCGVVLEMLDVEAFVSWRAEVREKHGAPAPSDAPSPADAPAPTGGGRNDAPTPTEPPAAASAVDAPAPEHLKHGLDALVTPAVPEISTDDLAAALGAPVERTRTIGLAGLVEGVRHQAAGGKALDVLRVLDPALADAIRAGTVPGTDPGAWAEVGATRWVDLGRDTDGAFRWAGQLADGGVLYVRLRGVKFEDAHRVTRLVMEQTA